MFIGRQYELEQLNIFFKQNKADLAVCCGRRRIGKSTLIEYAAKNHRFLAPSNLNIKSIVID